MTAPLSPERIAEIRRTHNNADRYFDQLMSVQSRQDHLDRGALLAHVDHQAVEIAKRDAEIESLRSALDGPKGHVCEACDGNILGNVDWTFHDDRSPIPMHPGCAEEARRALAGEATS